MKQTNQDSELDTSSRLAARAEAALVDLQNTEFSNLKGRPTFASIERISNYLGSDQIYMGLRDLYSITEPGRAELMTCAERGDTPEARAEVFHNAVRERLSIFERLLSRNAEVRQHEPENAGWAWAYRLLTVSVFEHLKSSLSEDDTLSVFRLPQFEKTKKAQDTLRGTDAAQTDSPPSPAGDELLFNRIAGYLQGRAGTFSEMATLSNDVTDSMTSPEDSLVKGMLLEALGEDSKLFRHLRRAKDLVDACRLYSASANPGIAEQRSLNLILNSIKADPPYGMKASELMGQLVKEGLLTETQLNQLERTENILAVSLPLTVEIADSLAARHAPLTPEELVKLNEGLDRLQRSGFDVKASKGALMDLAAKGTIGVNHLGNLASLTEAGLEIKRWITQTPEKMSIIHFSCEQLKRGAFYESGTKSINTRELTKIITHRLAEVATASEEVRQAVQQACVALEQRNNPPLLREVEEALSPIARAIYQTERPAEENAKMLASASSALVRISLDGGSPAQYKDILENPTNNASAEDLLQFLNNLDSLYLKGVDGIGRLLHDTHYSWSQKRRGINSQDIRGFLIEAQTILRLTELGYSIEKISVKRKTGGFSYDALGYTPEGRACAIEVKRQLSTISSKDREDLENNQIVRLLRAASSDKLLPLLVIAHSSTEDNWASVHVEAMFGAMKTSLGLTPPGILSAETGRRIYL